MESSPQSKGRRWASKLLDPIERIGNRLPDPLTLFVILAALVPILSYVAARSGWKESYPGVAHELIAFESEATRAQFDSGIKARNKYLQSLQRIDEAERVEGEPINRIDPVSGNPVDPQVTIWADEVVAENLLTKANVQKMFTTAVSNFTGFHPLGVVLVAMIGIGVLERSGLIAVLLKLMVTNVPPPLISAAVVFAGVMSSAGADVGYVVMTPLGAVVFAGLGRHPLAGLAAAFAGVSGGFSANLVITSLDPLLAGITTEGMALIDPDYIVSPLANYYFMIVSTFMVTLIGWYVTDKIVEPRLGVWDRSASDEPDEDARLHVVTPQEIRGVYWAACGLLLVIVPLLYMILPVDGALRGPIDANGEADYKPVIDSIIPILVLLFFVPGVFYGVAVGKIKGDKVVAKMTADTMATMGVYIVLAFAASQFIAYFGWSRMGEMLAISGAAGLQSIGFEGIPLLVGFILLAGCMNLFIGSASAKWAIMAPVFVPMLHNMGIAPELTQACYRIGDSTTNIITPLMPYFPIVLAFGQKYDKRLSLGTLIAAMLPYSIAFTIGWIILIIIWTTLGVPLGPGIENGPDAVEAAVQTTMHAPGLNPSLR